MSHKPQGMERILAVLTYLTLGWAGVVILIIQALGKIQPTRFVMYHVLQSIFLCFSYFLLLQICDLLMNLIAWIPIINNIPILLNMSIPLLAGFSIIQAIVGTVLIYLVISAFLGQYSFIPWVSNIIRYWLR